MDKARIPSKAAALGYSGVIPFAAATAIVAFGDDRLRQLALDGFLIYGAVILSFLGGIRWGAASTDIEDPGRGLLLAVLPSLWAALALWWLPDKVAAWWLMAGFMVMGLADGLFPGPNVPEWMKSLRTRLTVAVVACHLLVTSTF